LVLKSWLAVEIYQTCRPQASKDMNFYPARPNQSNQEQNSALVSGLLQLCGVAILAVLLSTLYGLARFRLETSQQSMVQSHLHLGQEFSGSPSSFPLLPQCHCDKVNFFMHTLLFSQTDWNIGLISVYSA
jgi:hypothetical protein